MMRKLNLTFILVLGAQACSDRNLNSVPGSSLTSTPPALSGEGNASANSVAKTKAESTPDAKPSPEVIKDEKASPPIPVTGSYLTGKVMSETQGAMGPLLKAGISIYFDQKPVSNSLQHTVSFSLIPGPSIASSQLRESLGGSSGFDRIIEAEAVDSASMSQLLRETQVKVIIVENLSGRTSSYSTNLSALLGR